MALDWSIPSRCRSANVELKPAVGGEDNRPVKRIVSVMAVIGSSPL